MPPNQNSVVEHRSLKIAIIGQSAFAVDVFHRLRQHGHIIVGVFTILDKGKREDPLAKVAKEHDIPLFKYKTWRKSGELIPTILTDYQSTHPDLNVLPYCSQFIPDAIINHPPLRTICYHPSLLPRHRGASAINWTLIEGDPVAGLTIFWADDGLDTGPILLQERADVERNDTVDSLYKRFLYPAGVAAVARAVDLVARGEAPRLAQADKGATYDPMLNKRALQAVDWRKTAIELHNFVRGLDSVPGALCQLIVNGQSVEVALFGSELYMDELPADRQTIEVFGLVDRVGFVHANGLLLPGADGAYVNVKRIKVNGKMRNASQILDKIEHVQLDLSDKEIELVEAIRSIWETILNDDITDESDFFNLGGGSMDVVRLVEEVKELVEIEEGLENEDLFMATTFEEFGVRVIGKLRDLKGGGSGSKRVEYKGVEMEVNKMKIRFPTQLFIGGKFVDAEDGKTLPIVNPDTEEIICEVQHGTPKDVDKAVQAAKAAFETGEWSKISARDRAHLLHTLADLLHRHRAELATIESLDSGAVYTLALKTHVGMSVETWRYMAGWCDKIHGATIPVSHARPHRNLTYTRKEPIGVCGLITPWNYPLMMLSWKMAACLAAGNTVVIKPAGVCPLTALKFAELSVLAGFPAGVINVVAGCGPVTGNAIVEHPDVRKVGFTGSTEIGRVVMRGCADGLKRCSLELGGKSPLVIFADCDLDKAVRVGMQSVFFNKGENCIAAGRIFVESSIHDEFLRRVTAETRKLKIGAPLDRSTAHGPQNHGAHLAKLLAYVARGVAEGARLVCGGARVPRPGFYLQPTILADVTDAMYVAREESFGPVMVVSRFGEGGAEEAARRANATAYGLAAGVFTRDLAKALRFAERAEAGTVFVNTYNKTDVAAPFGGCKASGFGKDLGREALDEYLRTKCVTIEY